MFTPTQVCVSSRNIEAEYFNGSDSLAKLCNSSSFEDQQQKEDDYDNNNSRNIICNITTSNGDGALETTVENANRAHTISISSSYEDTGPRFLKGVGCAVSNASENAECYAQRRYLSFEEEEDIDFITEMSDCSVSKCVSVAMEDNSADDSMMFIESLPDLDSTFISHEGAAPFVVLERHPKRQFKRMSSKTLFELEALEIISPSDVKTHRRSPYVFA